MKNYYYSKRSMIKIESQEDLDLIEEAEKYEGFRFASFDFYDFNYMQKMFFLRPVYRSRDHEFNFYYKNQRLHMFILRIEEDRYHAIFGYVQMKKITQKTPRELVLALEFYKEFYEQHSNGHLANFLDPNYGGSFDEEHKNLAALIMYG